MDTNPRGVCKLDDAHVKNMTTGNPMEEEGTTFAHGAVSGVARQSVRLVAKNAVTRVIAESTSMEDAIPRILAILGEAFGWPAGAFWLPVEGADNLRCEVSWCEGDPPYGPWVRRLQGSVRARGPSGLAESVWDSGESRWHVNLGLASHGQVPGDGVPVSLASGFAFPAKVGSDVVAVMEFFGEHERPRDSELLATMENIGAQVGQYVRRVLAQQAILETNARLELALEAGGMGAWSWELSTNAVTWSAGLEQIHGIPVGSFPGTFEAYQSDIHPDDKARVLASISETRHQGRPHNMEYRIIRPDGAVRWLETRGRFMLDAKGEPVRLVGVCSDITARKETTGALQLSEAFHSATLMSVGDAVVATDERGRIKLMNGVAQALTGWTFGDAKGLRVDEVVLVVDGNGDFQAETPLTRLMQGEPNVELAPRSFIRRRNGALVATEGRATPILSDLGDVVGVVVVLRDVTEKRQEETRRLVFAEASALLGMSLDYRESLQSLAQVCVANVADICTVHVVEYDRVVSRLALAYCESAAGAAANALPHTSIGQSTVPAAVRRVITSGQPEFLADVGDDVAASVVLDVLGPELSPSVKVRTYAIAPIRAGQRVLGAVTLVQSEPVMRYRDAEMRLLEDIGQRIGVTMENARLFHEAERARVAAEAAARRTTDLQKIAAAFSEAATPTSVLEVITGHAMEALGANAIAVAVVSEDGEHLDIVCSKGFPEERVDPYRRMPLNTALPATDAIRTKQAIFVENAEELKRLYPELDPSSTTGARLAVPIVAEGPVLGCLIVTYSIARPFSAVDRSLARTLAQLCAAALERARLFEAEQRARAQAEVATRTREDMLAVVSHDLRNPLSSIVTGVSLLERQSDGTDEKSRRYIEIIKRSVARMNRLIEDLLDLANIDAGRLEVVRKTHKADPILRECLDMMGPLAHDKKLRLEAESTSPDLWVFCDRGRVLQIFSNLVGNAIKFTPEGGRIVVRAESDGGHVVFSVTDTGAGIAPEQLPHIFDRYWQATKATRAGIGLGLSIAEGLVEAHGGRMWVTSVVGKGSSFFFTIPMTGAPAVV